MLMGCLPELMRVSKEGAVMMIPQSWLGDMEAARVPFRQLTKDVSHSASKFPVCYIQIEKE